MKRAWGSCISPGRSGVPSFGLVVEGEYDVAVFGELVRRICPAATIARAIHAGGSPLMKKFPVYLKALQYVTPEGPVGRALVIRDSNGKDPQEVERVMQSRIAGYTYNFPHGFALHAVRQETETWLLADAHAISVIADGRPVAPVGGELEALTDPKERLHKVLSDAGLNATPATYARITRELDLDVLRARCPGFLIFEQKVLPGCMTT
jgi:Domain of unknown function (DUF4276)